MKDRRPPRKEGPRRRGIKVTDISEKRALLDRIKRDRRMLSPMFVLIPLAVIFATFGVVAEGEGRSISTEIMGDVAAITSVGHDTGDVLAFEINMTNATILISHTTGNGENSKVEVCLQEVVRYEEVDGERAKLESYQIADLPHSAKVYPSSLEDVKGWGLEVKWRMHDDSNLKLRTELFDQEITYKGLNYGPTKAAVSLELNYPEEGVESEVSMEVKVLSSHADLSWQDKENFLEISASLPSFDIVIGFDKHYESNHEMDDVSISARGTEGGVALVADFQEDERILWNIFLTVDITSPSKQWHPSFDPIMFASSAVASGIAIIFIKSRYLRLRMS